MISMGSPGGQTRELRLKLTVDAQTQQANMAMQQLARQTQMVAQGATQAQREMFALHSWGAGYDRKTGQYVAAGQSYDANYARQQGMAAADLNRQAQLRAQQARAPGFLQQAGQAFGVNLPGAGAGGLGVLGTAGAIFAAVKSLDGMLQAFDKIGDSAATGEQKLRALAAVIPLLGDSFANMFTFFNDRLSNGGDAGLDGINARIESYRMRSRTMGFVNQYANSSDALRQQQDEAGIRYNTLRAYPIAPYMDDPSRSGYQNARGRGEQQAAAAARERNIAARLAAMAENRVAPALDRSRAAQEQANHDQNWALQQRNYSNDNMLASSKPLQEALARAAASRQASLQETANTEQAIVAAKEKQVNLARMENEFRQAQTQILKSQYDELARREQLVRGAAGGFAASPIDQRARLLEAKRVYEREGWNNTPQEFKQLLMGSPFGERVRKDAEAAGNNDPAFAELRKFGGMMDADVLAGMKGRLKAGIEAKVVWDEEQLAKALADALEKYGPMLEKILKEKLDGQVRQAVLQVMQGKAASN